MSVPSPRAPCSTSQADAPLTSLSQHAGLPSVAVRSGADRHRMSILLGIVSPRTAVAMEPLGLGFIKLIKMLIAPVIFCTVVLGIAGVADVKRVGRTG
jgi:hypothetical protein